MSHFVVGVPSSGASGTNHYRMRLFIILLLIGFAAGARPGSPATVMTQQSDATKRSQLPEDIRRVQPGQPVERDLAGGDAHVYELTLAAGQYLLFVVDQRGIDVVVEVFDPGGKQMIQVDSPNGSNGPERVVLVSKEAGTYRLK